MDGILNWIKNNTLMAVGLGVGVYFLFFKKK